MGSQIVRRVVCIIFAGVLLLALTANVKAEEKKELLKGKTVNINTATESELVAKLEIPPAAARAIVKRQPNWRNPDELTALPGINAEIVRKIRDLITV